MASKYYNKWSTKEWYSKLKNPEYYKGIKNTDTLKEMISGLRTELSKRVNRMNRSKANSTQLGEIRRHYHLGTQDKIKIPNIAQLGELMSGDDYRYYYSKGERKQISTSELQKQLSEKQWSYYYDKGEQLRIASPGSKYYDAGYTVDKLSYDEFKHFTDRSFTRFKNSEKRYSRMDLQNELEFLATMLNDETTVKGKSVPKLSVKGAREQLRRTRDMLINKGLVVDTDTSKFGFEEQYIFWELWNEFKDSSNSKYPVDMQIIIDVINDYKGNDIETLKSVAYNRIADARASYSIANDILKH